MRLGAGRVELHHPRTPIIASRRLGGADREYFAAALRIDHAFGLPVTQSFNVLTSEGITVGGTTNTNFGRVNLCPAQPMQSDIGADL